MEIQRPLREECLPEEGEKKQSRPQFPLKRSGEPREVAGIRFWEESVRELLEQHPAHFEAFRLLVEGRKEEVSEQHIRDLRSWLFLARDRSVLPGPRAIIESCYRETPDGPCIVDPFDVKSPADAAQLQAAEEINAKVRAATTDKVWRALHDKKARKELKRELLGDEDNDKGKDRPR
jgi:hypothetical protein